VSKAARDLAKFEAAMVEVDGEYCIPQEANEIRHYIDLGPVLGRIRSGWYLVGKLLLFLPALFLFVLAIQLMKAGAQAVGPQIQGQFPFANAASTMGTGWLGAYLVLSGSPVAATAISLFGAGTTSVLQTFTMLSGSRLGASFIVLLTGFLYAMRNPRARREPLGIGIQAMTMTAITYLPGMVIGYIILRDGLLNGVNWHASGKLEAAFSKVYGPFVDFAEAHLPGWALFVVGIGTILLAFSLIDKVLPEVNHTTASRHMTWLKKPWTMFLLGCIVATLTLSVSVALTVLVPLAVKGYVKRDEALPYIMGANITTLADTLVVAMLQPTPVAARIVLAEAIGVTIVSLLILALIYGPVKRGVIALDDYLVAKNIRLAGFVVVLFLIPIALLLTGLLYSPA
jgi:solute carrier family 34 (sodium-dependent phosphate cotransporter)